MFLFLWILLFLLWIIDSEKIYKLSNINQVVFLLDVSNSMNVEDVFYNWIQTSRLNAAKKFIKDYVNKNNNTKVWVIVFSETANFFLPPTQDKDNLITYIDTITTKSMLWQWTNIANAIDFFIKNTQKWTLWVILSDFGNEQDYNQQLDKLLKIDPKDHYIIAIWVWSEKWWPVKDSSWNYIYKDYKTVYDKLNLKYLNKVANLFWNKKTIINKDLAKINLSQNIYKSFWKSSDYQIVPNKKWYLAWVFFVLAGL